MIFITKITCSSKLAKFVFRAKKEKKNGVNGASNIRRLFRLAEFQLIQLKFFSYFNFCFRTTTLVHFCGWIQRRDTRAKIRALLCVSSFWRSKLLATKKAPIILFTGTRSQRRVDAARNVEVKNSVSILRSNKRASERIL